MDENDKKKFNKNLAEEKLYQQFYNKKRKRTKKDPAE